MAPHHSELIQMAHLSFFGHFVLPFLLPRDCQQQWAHFQPLLWKNKTEYENRVELQLNLNK